MNTYVGIVIAILVTVLLGTSVFMGGDGTVQGTLESTIKNVNSEISDITK